MGYKNIIITGASGGIGQATAIALAKQGANLLLCGRAMKGLEITIKECEKQQVHCIPYLYDICQPDAIPALIDTAVNELGRIDALINCAGIYPKDGVDQLTTGLWDQVMEAPAVTLICNLTQLGRQIPNPSFFFEHEQYNCVK